MNISFRNDSGAEGGASSPSSASSLDDHRPIHDKYGTNAELDLVRTKRGTGILMHRDELLDAQLGIAGYRFNVTCLDPSPPPSAHAVVQALKAESLDTFVKRRMAVVHLTIEDWRNDDYRQFISPNTLFMVGIPHAGRSISTWQDGLEEIKVSGAKIALDSRIVSFESPAREALLSLANALFIRFSDYSLEGFDRMVVSLRDQYPDLILIADDINTWSDFRTSVSIGIRYCLGSFITTTDQEDDAERLTPSRIVLVKMLNLLRRDADAAELSAVAKRDLGIIVKIMEMANSPIYGLSSPIASLSQAMIVLGRWHLYRWVTCAIFRAGTSPERDEALLQIALCRARFLELLAIGRRAKQECDELFMVGLLSLMDRLLGMPMADVLNEIHLPANVAEALLKNEGPYGGYLMLARAIGDGHTEAVASLAEGLGLDAEALNVCNASALLWAEDAMKFT